MQAGQPTIENWYSIVVCIAICYINGLVTGWVTISAVLVTKLEEAYQGTPFVDAQASLITSVNSGFINFTLFATTALLRIAGVRKVAFFAALVTGCCIALSPYCGQLLWWLATYSFPEGLAIACIYSGIMLTIPLYFDRHLGRMYGSMCFMSGLMSFGMPLMWSFLEPLGFRTSMHVFGLLLSSTVLPILLLKPPSRYSQSDFLVNESTTTLHNEMEPLLPSQSQSKWSILLDNLNFKVFRERFFVVLCAGMAFSALGIYVPTTHVESFAKLYYPNQDTNFLISAMGIGQAVSKLLCASSVDYLPLKTSYFILQLGQVGCGITAIFLVFAITTQQHITLILAAMVAYGVFEGPVFSMNYPIVCRKLGSDIAPSAVSFQAAISGCCSMIGPPLAGLLYDFTYSYPLCFVAAAIPTLLGSLIMFLQY